MFLSDYFIFVILKSTYARFMLNTYISLVLILNYMNYNRVLYHLCIHYDDNQDNNVVMYFVFQQLRLRTVQDVIFLSIQFYVP